MPSFDAAGPFEGESVTLAPSTARTANGSGGPYVMGARGTLRLSLAVTAAIPLLQYGISERGERARRKALEREQKLEVFLAACLVYVVRNAGADFEHTGIQAFMVRGRFRPRHVRLAKVRLGAVPTSGIVWYAGVLAARLRNPW